MNNYPKKFLISTIDIKQSNPDDNFNSNNISLLIRGLQMLSITQLRELLRDYNLPTGGNKKNLIEKLVIFLETFSPNQQNLLVQFSRKLKKMLSVEEETESNNITNQSNGQVNLLPPELFHRIIENSPSILFEPIDLPLGFGPQMVDQNYLNEIFEFSLSIPNSNITSILQFVPIVQDIGLKSIGIQINSKYFLLSEHSFWCSLSDLNGKTGTFSIVSIDPNIPIIAVIRYMKKISIPNIITEIIKFNKIPQDLGKPLNSLPNFCPLTRKILITPSRGKNCLHHECFDLSGFLSYSIRNNICICPICHKNLITEDLCIDYNYHIFVE